MTNHPPLIRLREELRHVTNVAQIAVSLTATIGGLLDLAQWKIEALGGRGTEAAKHLQAARVSIGKAIDAIKNETPPVITHIEDIPVLMRKV